MRLSVVMPVLDGRAHLERSLPPLLAADELIVVDDGSDDGSAELARAAGARVLPSGGRALGPARARNVGATAATGDVLVFVDADVVVAPDVLARLRAAFEDPGTTAVFGSYDDRPSDPGFASQYMNLRHHLVHQDPSDDAETFWAGLGAVRRDAFAAAGGFDAARYPRASVEDIDLGRRLRAGGGRIRRVPQIQGTHLKRWTMRQVIRTDVARRALPWAEMMLRHPGAFSDLNVSWSERWKVLLALGLPLSILAAVGRLVPASVPLVLLGLAALASQRLARLVLQRNGPAFALGALAVHQLYFLYGAGTYAFAVLRQHGAILAAVLLVTAAGLLLRWVGIDNGLPHRVEPDDVIVSEIELVRAGRDFPSKYPIVVATLGALLPWPEVHPPPPGSSLPSHLEVASVPHARVRRLVAILSSLVIPATYLLARRFLTRGWSLLAAAFMATSLLHICYSQQVRPHGPVTTFSLLAVLAALWMADRGSTASLLLAGVLAGLAAGCLHNGLFALGPLAALFCLRQRRAWLPLVIAAAIAAWAYAPTFAPQEAPGEGQPPVISVPIKKPAANPPPAVEKVAQAPKPAAPKKPRTLLLPGSGHQVYLAYFHGGGLLALFGTLASNEPALLLLSAVGLAVGLWRFRRRRDVGLVLAFVLPYVLVFGAYDLSIDRYFLPLLPYVAVLAAVGLQRLPRGWAPVLAVAALAFPVAVSVKYAWLRARPDTVAETAQWIGQSLDKGEARIFVGPGLSLPVLKQSRSLHLDSRWVASVWDRYQARLDPVESYVRGYAVRYLTLAESYDLALLSAKRTQVRDILDECAAGWAVSSVSAEDFGTEVRFSDSALATVQAIEAAGGHLVAAFDPFPDEARSPGASTYPGYRLGPRAALDVLRARALGPRVEIHRIAR